MLKNLTYFSNRSKGDLPISLAGWEEYKVLGTGLEVAQPQMLTVSGCFHARMATLWGQLMADTLGM